MFGRFLLFLLFVSCAGSRLSDCPVAHVESAVLLAALPVSQRGAWLEAPQGARVATFITFLARDCKADVGWVRSLCLRCCSSAGCGALSVSGCSLLTGTKSFTQLRVAAFSDFRSLTAQVDAKTGHTALHLACLQPQRADFAVALIAAGCDVNAKTQVRALPLLAKNHCVLHCLASWFVPTCCLVVAACCLVRPVSAQ